MEISKFDNEISIVYKLAGQYNLPAKYIYSRKVRPVDDFSFHEKTYLPVINYIGEELAKNTPISLIFENSNLSLSDFELLLVDNYIKQNTPLTQILDYINQVHAEISEEEGVLLKNENELTALYEDWERRNREQVEKEGDKLSKILDIQGILEELEPLPFTPLEIYQVKLEFNPTLKNGDKITPNDYIEIFDNVVLNKTIPYLQYNEPSRKLSKIYKPFPYNYNNIMIPEARAPKNQRFYFTIWVGDKPIKESFIEGTYNLYENSLVFTVPLIDRDRVVEDFQQTFTNLNLGEYEVVKINGEFNIPDFELNDRVLLDLIMNDELFSNYLFVDETVKAYPDKKRFTIHYKSIEEGLDQDELKPTGEGYIKSTSSVIVSLTQKYTEKDNIPYVYVKMKKATNPEVAAEFLNIFTRLLREYNNQKTEIDELYESFIPKSTKVRVKEREGKKLKKKILNEVVTAKDYSVKCQHQPDVVESEDLETVLGEGKQIMTFPKDGKYNLVCNDPVYKFPGIQTNKDPSSVADYPYFPCCFKKDHINDPTSLYSEFYLGKTAKKKRVKSTKTTHLIQLPTKVLDVDRIGLIPTAINNVLKLYSPDATDFKRIGVQRGPNSLIECVLTALDDPYYKEKSRSNKLIYVNEIRKSLSETILPSLLKQELFDLSDEQIITNLNDETIFFDPALYYRALEVKYDINIYVFVPDENDDTSGNLEIPRHKMFCSKTPNINKNTVLIYKNKGSEADILTYPQCELIYMERTKQFGPAMSELCHNLFLTTNKTISYNYDGNDQTLNTHENVYSVFNFNAWTKNQATSQYVDDYGKMRALNIPNGEGFMTIIVPPSQPENLPQNTTIYNNDVDAVVGIFGEPIEVSKTNSGMVLGLWYQFMTVKNGIYVPVYPTRKFNQLANGPVNPLATGGMDIASRTRKLQRDLSFIVQISQYLFAIYKLQKPKATLTNFIQKYIQIFTETVEDSASFYDLTEIPRILPKVQTVKAAINIFHQVAPTLFTPTKMILYSQNFATKIESRLKNYSLSLVGTEVKVPEVLTGYYDLDIYFKQNINTVIFTNERDLQVWYLNINRPSQKQITIREDIKPEYMNITEPFIYRSPTNRLYQVQNVIGGNFLRAITVAANWYSRKIDTGYASLPYEFDIPVHLIYEISAAFNLIPYIDRREGSEIYLEFVYYGGDRYAALLPL